VTRYPSVPLDEVLELSLDEVPVRPDETYRMAGVYSFGRGLFARSSLDAGQTRYRTLRRLRHRQLVYGRLNAWEGALAIVPRELEGAFVSQEYPTFDIRGDAVDVSYLGWLLRWPSLWDALHRTARGIGSRRGARRLRVRPDDFLATTVPLPSLDEQRRIVERMDRVAAVAEAAASMSATTDVLTRSLLTASLT
jgi:type I restriction enzyme S subunit